MGTASVTPKRHTPGRLAQPHYTHQTDNLLFVLENDPFTHRIHNFGEKLGRMTSWEADLLGQIIRQKVQKVFVPLLVQQWLVDEFCISVAFAALGDGEVEV